MSDVVKVYSPSAMKNWVRCPIYAQLIKKKQPKGEWKPNLLMGRSMEAALVHYYRAWQRLGAAPGKDIQGEALDLGFAELVDGYKDNERWPLEGLSKMLQRVYTKALLNDAIGTSTIVSVDESTGIGRPDLVLRQRNGLLLVEDRKFTMKLENQWEVRTLSEYELDDQFWHYAWEVEQLYGIEVEWLRVRILVGAPTPRVVVHPWRVTRERLSLWLASAQQNWKDMWEQEQGERPVVGNWQNCRGKYGACPFLGWCHEPVETRDLFYEDVEPRDYPDGS